jgi:hypothetical protein
MHDEGDETRGALSFIRLDHHRPTKLRGNHAPNGHS